jgi:hypothetical protein
MTLAGTKYLPDAEGTFSVPDEHAAELISIHGASREQTAADLEGEATAAELRAAQIKQQLDAVTEEAKAARAKADAAKAKAATAAEPAKTTK